MPARVLIVEHDADRRDLLTLLLEQEGYEVTSAHGRDEALGPIGGRLFEVVLVDVGEGVSLADAEQLAAAARPTPVGIVSSTPIPEGRGFAFALSGSAASSALVQEVAAASGAALPSNSPDAALVRRYFLALGSRDWALLGTLVSAEVTYVLEGTTESINGRSAFQQYAADTFAHFPDATFPEITVFRTPHGAAARYRGEWREGDGAVRALAGSVVFGIADGLIRSVGVRLDLQALADSRAWGEHLRARGGEAARLGGLSTRQVAQLLGVAEATIKRLSDAGAIACVRVRTVRRFAWQHVVDYLREGQAAAARVPSVESARSRFAEAAREGAIAECTATALELFSGANVPVARILDELVLPAVAEMPEGFVERIAERLSALSTASRKSQPSIVVPFGTGVAARLASCALRAHGLEVLALAASRTPDDVVDLAARSRPRLVIFAASGSGQDAIAAARAVAPRVASAAVCVYLTDAAPLASAPDVVLLRSTQELARLLDP